MSIRRDRGVQLDAAGALLAALDVEDLHNAGAIRYGEVVDDVLVADVEEGEGAGEAAAEQICLDADLVALAPRSAWRARWSRRDC